MSRGLPWHLALRADRRAFWTSFSMALCVAFSLVSYAVPEGLRSETISRDGPYADTVAIVTTPEGSWPDPSLGEWSNALGFPLPLASGGRVTVVAFEGELGALATEGIARPGKRAPVAFTEIVPADGSLPRLPVGEPIDSAYVATGWLLVSTADASALGAATSPGAFRYSIAFDPSSEDLERWGEAGLLVTLAPAAGPFLKASALEVVGNLVLVVVFCSILVGILAYETMRAEVRDKRREIGLWRSLGLRRADVAILLVGRGLVMGVVGGAFGVGLATGGLAIAYRLSDAPMFLAAPPPLAGALVVVGFAVASGLGALLPALDVARRTIEWSLEAAE